MNVTERQLAQAAQDILQAVADGETEYPDDQVATFVTLGKELGVLSEDFTPDPDSLVPAADLVLRTMLERQSTDGPTVPMSALMPGPSVPVTDATLDVDIPLGPKNHRPHDFQGEGFRTRHNPGVARTHIGEAVWESPGPRKVEILELKADDICRLRSIDVNGRVVWAGNKSVPLQMTLPDIVLNAGDSVRLRWYGIARRLRLVLSLPDASA